ncbi:hypothetical protein BGZ81_008706 [Podila clonocystis]|nr:hypothetical protein BGZ81_008706 [Podila clonocystis]
MSLPLTQFVKLGRAGSIRRSFTSEASLPNMFIHHYDITISSDMPLAVYRHLFDESTKAYREPDLEGVKPIFDGHKNILLSDITLRSRSRKVAEFRFKEQEQFLKGKVPATPACLTAIQSFDILLRQTLMVTLPYVRVGHETGVPIKVCKVLPDQQYARKFSEAQLADMSKFTFQNPTARVNTLKTGLKMLSYRDNEYLKDVGMAISEDMVQIPARVLPHPTVRYRPDSLLKTAPGAPRDESLFRALIVKDN